jgi:hypothetical protein
MVETVARVTDCVFPRLPKRRWVLLAPKRLRHYRQRDGVVLNRELRIFCRGLRKAYKPAAPGRPRWTKQRCISANAFIYRFGSSLKGHVHFDVCSIDGVLEDVAVAVDRSGTALPKARRRFLRELSTFPRGEN